MEIGGVIVLGITVFFCDVVFLVIGLNYLRSKAPLGFFTGEKPPKPEEIRDVQAWNRKHGIAWFVFAGLITIGCISMIFIPESLASIFIFFGSFAVAIIGIIVYHYYLVKKYKIQPDSYHIEHS